MTSSSPPRGQLCIWTDVDPAFERDFNRWYDREHMQERLAIPGFVSARRFRAIGECPRPWLALYCTQSLEVFRSDAYRSAFANQTPWSLSNFARMRGTERRVGELVVERGDGEGGALALFTVAPGTGVAPIDALLTGISGHDDVIRVSVLRTDAGLSAPVTPDKPAVPADLLVSVESGSPDTALAEARRLAGQLGCDPHTVFAFRMLWRIPA
jgi:hypothetical protein